MNKREFVKRLKELGLPKYQFIILSGGSLLMHELLEETDDIDLAISDVLAVELKIHNKEPNEKGTYEIAEDVEVVVGMNKYSAELVDDYLCETLPSIYAFKRNRDLPEDQKALEILHEYFTNESRS
ncbi:hypothetical protein IIZ77_01175 [Candidatus Saccharibacteria bacterium]|nr:hypothetical protein [Candidatus Saccharibacteria bacterium]